MDTKKQDKRLFHSLFKKNSNTDILGYFDHSDPVYHAAAMVTKYDKLNLNHKDRSYKTFKEIDEKLESIAEAANLFIEKVKLPNKWHVEVYDAMVLISEKTNKTYALIPKLNGRSEIVDPSTGKTVKGVSFDEFKYGYLFYGDFKPNAKLEVTYGQLFMDALRHNWWAILAAAIISLVIAVISWYTPVITSYLVYQAIPQNRIYDFFQYPLILLFLLVLIFILTMINNIILTKITIQASRNSQSTLLHHMLNLPISYYDTKNSGSTTLMTLSVQSIIQQLAGGQISAMFSIIIGLSSTVMMIYYLPSISLIVIGVLFIYFIFIITFAFFRLGIYIQSLALFQSTTGFLYQVIKGISKIKTTASETLFLNKWFKRHVITERVMYRVETMDVLETTFKSGIDAALTLIIYICIFIIMGSEINLGDYIGFTVAFGLFFSGITAMGDMVNNFAQSASTFKIIQPILKTKVETRPAITQRKIKVKGAIQGINLNYKFINHNQPVLKNLNFEIKPGEFVAIVGKSGSGKSTLLNLLLGFYIPISGALIYDGNSINQVNLKYLRKQFGVVLQDARLINGTIRDNLVNHGQEIEEKKIWQALQFACIDEQIKKMPMGIYTMISSSDKLISHGQAQRILIARAIINNPKVLFLDEATSALDSINQDIIMKSIENLNNTRIIITHRLSTIKNVDKILVIENGEIVESGTYNELYEKQGSFYSLLQSNK